MAVRFSRERLENGSVRGLHARGGFTVDMNWAEGRLVSAAVTAPRHGILRLENGMEFLMEPGQKQKTTGEMLKKQKDLQ